MATQRAMVSVAGSHHQNPGRLSGVGQDCRNSALAGHCADRQVGIRRPHGRFRLGEHAIAVGAPVGFGRVLGVGEMPVHPWDRVHERQRKRMPIGELRGPLRSTECGLGSVDTGDDDGLLSCGHA